MTVDQLAAKLVEAQIWIHFLGASVLALGAWIWFEGWLKRNGCPQCDHCRREKRERERLAKERSDSLARSYGLGKTAEEETRERLFGRRVVDEKDPEKPESDDSL